MKSLVKIREPTKCAGKAWMERETLIPLFRGRLLYVKRTSDSVRFRIYDTLVPTIEPNPYYKWEGLDKSIWDLEVKFTELIGPNYSQERLEQAISIMAPRFQRAINN